MRLSQVLARMLPQPSQINSIDVPKYESDISATVEVSLDESLSPTSNRNSVRRTQSKSGATYTTWKLDDEVLDSVVGWYRNYKRYNCLKERDSWAYNDTYFQAVLDERCASNT